MFSPHLPCCCFISQWWVLGAIQLADDQRRFSQKRCRAGGAPLVEPGLRGPGLGLDSIYLKPDESFVYIEGRVSIS